MVSNELKQKAEYVRFQVGLRERWRWNPRPPIFTGQAAVELETEDRTTIVIHHSGNSPAYDPKEVQDQHMDESGYGDIGYHYLIHPGGYGWVGRDIYYKGSHVSGQNGGKIGILMMGDFHRGSGVSNGGRDLLDGYGSNSSSGSQFVTCLRLINALKQVFPIRYLGGHRDFVSTDCPGDQLYPTLADWRRYSSLESPPTENAQRGHQVIAGGPRSSGCCT